MGSGCSAWLCFPQTRYPPTESEGNRPPGVVALTVKENIQSLENLLQASNEWELLMFKSEQQFRYLPKCLETNLHQRGRLNSYNTVTFLKILFPHEASSLNI